MRLLRSLGCIALTLFLSATPAVPADMGATVLEYPAPEAAGTIKRVAISNYLALQLVRQTFDVLTADDVQMRLTAKQNAWAGGVPGEAERAEINRQLLAEGSYYIVSLTYTIEAGGAVFPTDKPEASYVNETLVRLDTLLRELADRLDAGEDASLVLKEAEGIRALTEGYATPPAEFGPLAGHGTLLERAWDALEQESNV